MSFVNRAVDPARCAEAARRGRANDKGVPRGGARSAKDTGEATKEARRSVEAVLAVVAHLTATAIPRTAAALGGGEQVGVCTAH